MLIMRARKVNPSGGSTSDATIVAASINSVSPETIISAFSSTSVTETVLSSSSNSSSSISGATTGVTAPTDSTVIQTTASSSSSAFVTQSSSLSPSTTSLSTTTSLPTTTSSSSSSASLSSSTSSITTSSADSSPPLALSDTTPSSTTSPSTSSAFLSSSSNTSAAVTLSSTTAPSEASASVTQSKGNTAKSSSSSSSVLASSAAAMSSNSGTHSEATQRSISRGALAGGIVGAAVAAAAITFLITYCCLRSSGRGITMFAKSSRHRQRNQRSPRAGFEKATPSYEHAWEKYLPQSLDDRSIQSAVKTLFDQIQMHVENFYTNSKVKMTPDVATNLADMQTPFLIESVASVLASTRSPLSGIKHCLSYMVVRSVTGQSDPELSLLPPQYATISKDRGTRLDDDTTRQAFSKWRVLTAYLAPHAAKDPNTITARDAAIESLMQRFSKAFFPWEANPRDEGAAREHLAELLKSSADTAALLFAQPSSFEFRWAHTERDDGARHRRVIVATPEFVKVQDEHANILEKPQVIMQAVWERI